MTKVHDLYNKEMEDLRKALDMNANALAQNKIDNGRMRAELDEARTRYLDLNFDFSILFIRIKPDPNRFQVRHRYASPRTVQPGARGG